MDVLDMLRLPPQPCGGPDGKALAAMATEELLLQLLGFNSIPSQVQQTDTPGNNAAGAVATMGQGRPLYQEDSRVTNFGTAAVGTTSGYVRPTTANQTQITPEARRQLRAARNRESAARCRQRSRMLQEHLLSRVEDLQRENNKLRERIMAQQGELNEYRHAILAKAVMSLRPAKATHVAGMDNHRDMPTAYSDRA